ncbi:hypothetical protein CC1G_04706 [Coprinopsis cinerea okayama7|uniref:Asl1-like glycosyl hydrolase catalytic domain-containing protein n=1 Tax=Coprinopsis cinerea (strain Okayama-7 / 130 / ATCC MYA-4618 / FGSC 9003) TaxID=240176 RepID=A8P288_COPC7|nr:hypothetical protein CC1G_04706 [Coprinopsis cinerea okayama7\|eukprot:XP_001838262.1 hypothetical protein CC1G_04706 [Coprinopsis cinerea okayama7\
MAPPPSRYMAGLVISVLVISVVTAGAEPLIGAREIPSNASKAGLAWPNGNSVDISQYQASEKLSWYYTWSVWPAGNRRNNLEFVPMLWGSSTANEFSARINDTLRRSRTPVTAVLGMNEPEQRGQANMNASEGVAMWKRYMEPLRGAGLRLGSPAVSSAPSGKTWLEDFFRECNDTCNVDFVALHWYGTDSDAFIAHLWDYWYSFNRTIWVTEWACHNFVDHGKQCTPEDVVEFMNKTQSFMDNAIFVERYSWFGAMRDMSGVNPANALMDNDGRISNLGRQYVGWTGDGPVIAAVAGRSIVSNMGALLAAVLSGLLATMI